MFDFAWTEIALIGVVALIAIGPKDLPVAIKTVAGMVKKARRMASEFQTHVDEMVREADLHEVRNQIAEFKNFNVGAEIEKAVDADGSLRRNFAENPMYPTPVPSSPAPEDAIITPPPPAEPESSALPEPHAAEPPSFIPPAFVPPQAVESAPPAFIPPGTHRAS